LTGPQEISIAGKQHCSSLGFVVSTGIGPIGIRVPYQTIAIVDADVYAYVNGDVDANANIDADVHANANSNANDHGDALAGVVYSTIGCKFEILHNTLGSSHISGEWPRIVYRKSSDRIRDIWLNCKCCVHS
jgi:hypothetical protein